MDENTLASGVNTQEDAAPAAGEGDGVAGRVAADQAETEKVSFQELIAGPYREEYQAAVSKIVKARLKESANNSLEETAPSGEPTKDLARQEAEAKRLYPSFDMTKERQNPEFDRLLRAGVTVCAAYEVTHREDMLRSAMAFAAKQVRSQLANGLASRSVPLENGASPQRAALTAADVRSRSCREEIKARMRRGEKVTL